MPNYEITGICQLKNLMDAVITIKRKRILTIEGRRLGITQGLRYKLNPSEIVKVLMQKAGAAEWARINPWGFVPKKMPVGSKWKGEPLQLLKEVFIECGIKGVVIEDEVKYFVFRNQFPAGTYDHALLHCHNVGQVYFEGFTTERVAQIRAIKYGKIIQEAEGQTSKVVLSIGDYTEHYGPKTKGARNQGRRSRLSL